MGLRLFSLILLLILIINVHASEVICQATITIDDNKEFDLQGCQDLQTLNANQVTNIKSGALADCPNLKTVEMNSLTHVNGIDCTVENKLECSNGLVNVFQNSPNIQTLIMPKIKIGTVTPFLSPETKLQQLTLEEIQNAYDTRKACT